MKKVILKGIAASSGIAKGRAKIIISQAENSKMKKGDILITEMTNPLFVPAIQKALAIVTNIGGLTSHAAIIARELGIPCVVDTDKATRILKDNDIIEVDGNSGLVTLIKKYERRTKK